MSAAEENTQQTQKPYNLEPNAEAALAYLLGALTGIPVLLVEKENQFVRFHAMQSVIFTLSLVVLSVVNGVMLSIPILNILWGIGMAFIYLGVVIVWIMLMWKAYNHEEWELPYIGKIARDQLKNFK